MRVVPLPEGLDAEDFLGGGCGLPTGFHAVERAGIAMGDTVVVQGSGPVGLNAAIFAQLAGALRVFVVGSPRARLDAARRLGAEDTLDVARGARPRVAGALGPRPDVGPRRRRRHRGLRQSGRRPRGPRDAARRRRYVVVGQYTDGGDAVINPHRHVNRRHATVLGCWGYEFSHLHRALAMMRRHLERFRWRELVSREYALDEAGQALADMEGLSVIKALIRPEAKPLIDAADRSPLPPRASSGRRKRQSLDPTVARLPRRAREGPASGRRVDPPPVVGRDRGQVRTLSCGNLMDKMQT